MKKECMCVSIVVIFVCLALSGCQDTKSTATNFSGQNVLLQSTIVKFANVSFVKTINKSGEISSAKVSWLFQNIAGRMINATILVRFYDNKNVQLYNETKWIRYMPKGYTEKYLSPGANSVMFNDVNAALVDHVVITVTET